VIQLTVLSSSPEKENTWAQQLKTALQSEEVGQYQITAASSNGVASKQELGQVLFVDAEISNLEQTLQELDRRRRAVFLLVKEGQSIPQALKKHWVDDVLVSPFRQVEVLSKLRHYHQILAWDEVSRLNASFAGLIERLHDDLKLAERLQKAKLPHRFPEVKGFKVQQRYLAGLKSGGDHLDLAESRDGNCISLLLSDSSSYGLSSAVLSSLVRVANKLTIDQARSSYDTTRSFFEDVAMALSDKDYLSLFYGLISRKDLKFTYTHFGNSLIYHAKSGNGFQLLEAQGEVLSRSKGLPDSRAEGEAKLAPGDRLVIISDGFLQGVDSSKKLNELLDQKRSADANTTLNELVFKLKSKFTSDDDMPEQDCTCAVIDIDAKFLRLA
jgi:serine phosphatase RsbU (regulator of sigma subunit)